ncbi:MAG: glycosyltransferase family 2 protein [Candidatus Bathyarchaeia archaeon]
MSWPLVSVVIPTQSRERQTLLCRAINGVFGQDYPGPIECLVVFDRSKPVVPSVETKDGRFLRILTNVRAAGPSGTRNTGAMAARGEFLAFCDDDDEWLERKLRLQIDALANHVAVVATCGIYVCYEGHAIARLPPNRTLTFRDFLRSRYTEVHPSTLTMRRQTFFEYVGPLDENDALKSGYCADYEWILRASRRCRFVTVRKPLVRINWHPGAWSMMQKAARWEITIAALSYLIEKYPEFQQEPRGFARICGQIAFAYAALGKRAQSRQWTAKCLSINPLDIRAFLAILANSGLMRWETIVRFINMLGRGIT